MSSYNRKYKISAFGSLSAAIDAIKGSAATLKPSTGKTNLEFFTNAKASLANADVGTATASSTLLTSSSDSRDINAKLPPSPTLGARQA